MALSASRLQSLLAASEVFRARAEITLTKLAGQVLLETGIGTTHAARAAYAKYVLANPSGAATIAAVFLSASTNVAGTITYEDGGPTTSVSDAALESQVSSSWNLLAGIDLGS